jgi:hypothetical protein
LTKKEKRYRVIYKHSVLLGILVVWPFWFFTQNTTPYFSVGGAAGRIVPNYLNGYPKSSVRVDGVASLHLRTDGKPWAKYYNHPDVGVAVLASYLGNSKIFGNQLSIYPYLNLRVNQKEKPLFFKFGLGLAYFDTFFHPIHNPNNLAVGSSFTWHFSASFERALAYFTNGELRLTGGYFHASNGHTQIPNFGLNSALLGVEWMFKPKEALPQREKSSNTQSYWVLEHRSGIGFHELAATASPIGTPKYGVFSTGFNVGYVHREHIKYKAGLVGRYYNSYFNYISNKYGSSTVAQAGNVYFMAGAEFLLGHIGIDIEGGLNLYKPFFREFYETFENRSNFDYWQKALFNTRMGLNYYLFDCYSDKRFNIRIGAHINANFGQADFSDASVGVLVRLGE